MRGGFYRASGLKGVGVPEKTFGSGAATIRGCIICDCALWPMPIRPYLAFLYLFFILTAFRLENTSGFG